MDKEQQAKLLTEIVETNQKNGLYDILNVEKKRTAVEWLQIQLKNGVDYNPLDPLSYPKAVDNLFEQAKEMEKKQKEEEYKRGWEDATSTGIKEAHKYQ